LPTDSVILEAPASSGGGGGAATPKPKKKWPVIGLKILEKLYVFW